jgi:hypothetical protein
VSKEQTEQTKIKDEYWMHMEMTKGENSSGAVAFEARLKEGDLQTMANAVVMEVNFLAAQLFELFMLMNEIVNSKSKRVFRVLADEYQVRLEAIYGE